MSSAMANAQAWLVGASELKAWQRCPVKAKLAYKQRLRWPANQSHFTLGRTAHLLMDAHAQGNLSPELTQVWQTHPQHSDAFAVSQALTNSKVGQWPVIASEWAFNVPLLAPEEEPLLWPVRLIGRLDRIAQPPPQPSKGGKASPQQLAIVDWKTGTRIPPDAATAWQTRLYAYALVRSLGEFETALPWPEHPLQFVYVQWQAEAAVQTQSITYGQAQDEATHAELLAVVRAWQQAEQAQSYTLPATCPDKYCGLNHQCGILTPPPLTETPTEERVLSNHHLHQLLVLDETTLALF